MNNNYCSNNILLLSFSLQVEDSEEDDDTLLYKSPFKSTKKKEMLEKMKEVLINDKNPLLVCTNAMDKNHKCLFCKYYQCHMKAQEIAESLDKNISTESDKQKKKTRNQSRRVQKAKNIKQGQSVSEKEGGNRSGKNEKYKCNHIDDLSFFTDASFFSRSYKLRNEKINVSSSSKVHLPTKCSICDCEIVNKIAQKISKMI